MPLSPVVERCAVHRPVIDCLSIQHFVHALSLRHHTFVYSELAAEPRHWCVGAREAGDTAVADFGHCGGELGVCCTEPDVQRQSGFVSREGESR